MVQSTRGEFSEKAMNNVKKICMNKFIRVFKLFRVTCMFYSFFANRVAFSNSQTYTLEVPA